MPQTHSTTAPTSSTRTCLRQTTGAHSPCTPSSWTSTRTAIPQTTIFLALHTSRTIGKRRCATEATSRASSPSWTTYRAWASRQSSSAIRATTRAGGSGIRPLVASSSQNAQNSTNGTSPCRSSRRALLPSRRHLPSQIPPRMCQPCHWCRMWGETSRYRRLVHLQHQLHVLSVLRCRCSQARCCSVIHLRNVLPRRQTANHLIRCASSRRHAVAQAHVVLHMNGTNQSIGARTSRLARSSALSQANAHH